MINQALFLTALLIGGVIFFDGILVVGYVINVIDMEKFASLFVVAKILTPIAIIGGGGLATFLRSRMDSYEQDLKHKEE